MLIERMADALSPQMFINAEIVNIKGFNLCKYGTAGMLYENAEGIPHDLVIFIHCHINRTYIIFEKRDQLFVIIFPASFEKVGTAQMMDQINLVQELVYLRQIFFFGTTDIHLFNPPVLTVYLSEAKNPVVVCAARQDPSLRSG